MKNMIYFTTNVIAQSISHFFFFFLICKSYSLMYSLVQLYLKTHKKFQFKENKPLLFMLTMLGVIISSFKAGYYYVFYFIQKHELFQSIKHAISNQLISKVGPKRKITVIMILPYKPESFVEKSTFFTCKCTLILN